MDHFRRPVAYWNFHGSAHLLLFSSHVGGFFVSWQQFLQAKNALGEAFGTKKIKQQIKSVERNAVNVSTLDSVANILRDSISAKTSALPSKGKEWYYYTLSALIDRQYERLLTDLFYLDTRTVVRSFQRRSSPRQTRTDLFPHTTSTPPRWKTFTRWTRSSLQQNTSSSPSSRSWKSLLNLWQHCPTRIHNTSTTLSRLLFRSARRIATESAF